jgi:hypothetical protein
MMSDPSDRIRDAGHRECWEQLPWLVNDSLLPAQQQRLEEHLAHCDNCRREAQEQALLRDHVLREDAVLYAPQAALQKLMNRIDAAGPVRAPQRAGYELVGLRPAKMLAAALVFGAMVVIAVSAVSSWRLREERTAARYATLTSSPQVVAGVPAARVVFAPSMKLEQLTELLRAYRAQVVTGPTEAGVYTLMFPRQEADPVADRESAPAVGPDKLGSDNVASMEEIVARVIPALRKDPNVLFAEPVMANGGAGR